MADETKKSSNWGGKREGAGRHQSVTANSKTRSIYCSSQEFRMIKRFLEFERSLKADLTGEYQSFDDGIWTSQLKYTSFRRFLVGIMDDDAWNDFREFLRPDTIDRLQANVEKEKKRQKAAEAKRQASDTPK